MKIILIAAMSVNGMIAETTSQSSLVWTSKEDTRFFIEKSKESGVVVMGKNTFDTIGKGLPGREIVVMTWKPEEHEPVEGVVFTNKLPREIVDEYKTKGQQSMVIAGGSATYSAFMGEGLVTDLYLTVEPVFFGSGIPLASGIGRTDLQFVESVMLNDQSIMLHYQVI